MMQAIETPVLEAAAVSPEKPARTLHDYDAPIRETLAAIRFYSMVRCAALPLFCAAFAVLVAAFYDFTVVPRSVVVQAGIALSLIVGIFVITLSRHLIVLWHGLDAIFLHAPQWHVTRTHRHNATLWTARWVMFAPYPVTLVFWLEQLVNYVLFHLQMQNETLRLVLSAGFSLLAGVLMAHIAWRVWTTAEHLDHGSPF